MLFIGFLLAFIFSSQTTYADAKEYIIKATIVDENDVPVPLVDIANRRLQLSLASDKYGNFSTKVIYGDTLLLFKKGFTSHKLKIDEKILEGNQPIKIKIFHTPIELTEVQITALKTHQQIRKAINNISVPNTDLYPDAKLFQNPISYLYELISRKEKEKRLAANLQTEFTKRSVLKELFRLYNSFNIIDLPEEDFENFITYLDMPYEFMQSVSDYDLAITIKYKFKNYRADKNNWFKHEIYPPALDDLQKIKEQLKN